MKDNNRWVHPLAEALTVEKNGPFLRLNDGRLAAVDSRGICFSQDEGVSWSEPIFVCEGINEKEPASYDLVQTDDGTIVLLYLNFKDYRFKWDEENCEPLDCKLELWSVRSPDGGRTWIDNQRVVEGYNTNFFGFIKTSKGRLVAGVDHFISHPGRSVAMSVYSDDNGKSWQRSNMIDLGGRGHHDGAMEPTIAELSDGQLLMLIRTNLDRFWQAISDDGGKYWRRIEPSSIDASTSPGRLLRLKSGRLVLVWNRLNPEGGVYPKSGPWAGGEVPASWHREELSISFSEDDGKSWTPPVVIARQKGGQLSYPYLFEARPGELWVIAGFAFKQGWQDPFPLRLRLKEETFVKESKSKIKNVNEKTY
ncbi:exo-alpha-sialidase [bacterium]|nr:exo-alpha-sialidase [bacterium]